MRAAGLCPIYLIAPTTPEERIAFIAQHAAGFIYYISREGVTGMRDQLAQGIGTMTAKIRAHTRLPIAIGFGISTPEQARTVAAWGDAVVVGSAVVHRIGQLGSSPELVPQVSRFVETLVQAVKTVPIVS